MPTVLDRALRRPVRAILKQFGAPVTVTLIDKAAEYNAGQGREGKTETVISTYALALPDKGKPQKTPDAGGGIKVSTRWVLPGIDFPVRGPRKNDRVKRLGLEYRVVDALEHSTGELAGLYEIRVAR